MLKIAYGIVGVFVFGVIGATIYVIYIDPKLLILLMLLVVVVLVVWAGSYIKKYWEGK